MQVNQKDLEITRMEKSIQSSADRIKCISILFRLMMAYSHIYSKRGSDLLSASDLRNVNQFLVKAAGIIPEEFRTGLSFEIAESNPASDVSDRMRAIATQLVLWYRQECINIPILSQAEQERITEIFQGSDQCSYPVV